MDSDDQKHPNHVGCHISNSKECLMYQMLLNFQSKQLSDEESIAHVVFKELLKAPHVQSRNPKIALMFLNPRSLPFENLWDRENPNHVSPNFVGRDIHSEKHHKNIHYASSSFLLNNLTRC
ncbi:hypothetical protein ACFE04_028925 [Oxalis oulophora]